MFPLPIKSWVVLTFLFPSIAPAADAKEPQELQTDLLIVGGTESGWAAAVQAARMGIPSITLVHDTDWLGGQYTEQGLCCVDENKGVGLVGYGPEWHPMKRSFYRFGLFKELIDQIEAYNTRKYGSPMPGKPWHGPTTFRPAEAQAIFRRILQPYIDSGQVHFVTHRYPVEALTSSAGLRLNGLRFRSLMSSPEPDMIVRARMTIDASDWGEAIQVAGAAFECGPDLRSRYNEPSAPDDPAKAPSNEMNPITWPMIIEQADGETPIPEPERYDVRRYVVTSKLTQNAIPDLDWDRPQQFGGILHWPDAGEESPRQLSVYTVRRIVDGTTSLDGKTSILLNYARGQDYPLERLPARVAAALEQSQVGASQKNIVELTRQQRDIIFEDAKLHSLGLFYHFQTLVHERASDKTNSLRYFRLSPEFGTPDNLPLKPYIRESLRLKAMYMMREQDGRNFDGATKEDAREAFAKVMYPDGVLSWQFHYDFHRTGRAYLRGEGRDGPWVDYEKGERHTRHVSDRSVFPLRSLIPEKMDGLLGAQKNLGYSSIVSAAIRLHDQCVHLGQAAGATAAICLRENIEPRKIPFQIDLLEEVRHALCGGTPGTDPMLLWPYRDLQVDHPAYVAINRLAARFVFPDSRREVDFQPDEPADDEWKTAVVRRSLAQKQVAKSDMPRPPEGNLSRGAFAQHWWQLIRSLPDQPWLTPADPMDADNDQIPDIDDAFYLDADNDGLPDGWEGARL